MAIGFLAPQHTDTSQAQQRTAHGRQDLRVTTAARPQLEALAYGVNVQASMDVRQCSILPALPSGSSIPNCQQRRMVHPASCSPSRTSTPTTPSDQAKFDDSDRAPRERRDPYSDEMQFFIMFARIIKEHDWRKIEDDFERVFNQRRPRDGLTAVYYRIRNRWGMQQVLKSGPDKYKTDIGIVEIRSRGFPHQFLRQIGYTH